MKKKTPLEFIRMKGLYQDYLDWAGKSVTRYDKSYYRLLYWAKSVSQDTDHAKIYEQIRAHGYRCSIVAKIHSSKKWRIALEKDGHIVKVYVENKYDLCNKEFLDNIFQQSKDEHQ